MLLKKGFIIFGIGALLAALPDLLAMRGSKRLPPRAHAAVTAALFAVGCFLRLFRLASLSSGISAEEALTGVQAKALWQTGGFLFGGRLTAQLAQWQGEAAGPLLAAITAPFVGLGGMTPLMTRLPLALLSCLAMPAAYALGVELSGRRAGRWCLAAYALCPYFVLTARLTYAPNAAACLLPIAVWLLARGMRKPGALYAGAAVMALTAYAHEFYFVLAPAAILAAALVAAARGAKKRHALGMAALGLAVCLPALLTLVNGLTGGEGFTFLGLVNIPAIEPSARTNWVFADGCKNLASAGDTLVDKCWAVLTGGVFQFVMHDNMGEALFAPHDMLALYAFSVPLIGLGALSLARRRLRGERVEGERGAARAMTAALAAATFACLVLAGSWGMLVWTGTTSVNDYAALFLFDVLLMAAGLCRVERKSCVCALLLSCLFAANCCWLASDLFGGVYQSRANIYFHGFRELSVKAAETHRETGADVIVTSGIYPHAQPEEAARFMYLYATDADMRRAADAGFEVAYIPGIERPEKDCVYLTKPDEILTWDLDGFSYEEDTEFSLLTPSGT